MIAPKVPEEEDVDMSSFGTESSSEEEAPKRWMLPSPKAPEEDDVDMKSSDSNPDSGFSSDEEEDTNPSSPPKTPHNLRAFRDLINEIPDFIGHSDTDVWTRFVSRPKQDTDFMIDGPFARAIVYIEKLSVHSITIHFLNPDDKKKDIPSFYSPARNGDMLATEASIAHAKRLGCSPWWRRRANRELVKGGGVFRLWAPQCDCEEWVIRADELKLEIEKASQGVLDKEEDEEDPDRRNKREFVLEGLCNDKKELRMEIQRIESELQHERKRVRELYQENQKAMMKLEGCQCCCNKRKAQELGDGKLSDKEQEKGKLLLKEQHTKATLRLDAERIIENQLAEIRQLKKTAKELKRTAEEFKKTAERRKKEVKKLESRCAFWENELDERQLELENAPYERQEELEDAMYEMQEELEGALYERGELIKELDALYTTAFKCAYHLDEKGKLDQQPLVEMRRLAKGHQRYQSHIQKKVAQFGSEAKRGTVSGSELGYLRRLQDAEENARHLSSKCRELEESLRQKDEAIKEMVAERSACEETSMICLTTSLEAEELVSRFAEEAKQLFKRGPSSILLECGKEDKRKEADREEEQGGSEGEEEEDVSEMDEQGDDQDEETETDEDAIEDWKEDGDVEEDEDSEGEEDTDMSEHAGIKGLQSEMSENWEGMHEIDEEEEDEQEQEEEDEDDATETDSEVEQDIENEEEKSSQEEKEFSDEASVVDSVEADESDGDEDLMDMDGQPDDENTTDEAEEPEGDRSTREWQTPSHGTSSSETLPLHSPPRTRRPQPRPTTTNITLPSTSRPTVADLQNQNGVLDVEDASFTVRPGLTDNKQYWDNMDDLELKRVREMVRFQKQAMRQLKVKQPASLSGGVRAVEQKDSEQVLQRESKVERLFEQLKGKTQALRQDLKGLIRKRKPLPDESDEEFFERLLAMAERRRETKRAKRGRKMERRRARGAVRERFGIEKATEVLTV